MKKAIGALLLVAGIALIVYGFDASDSVRADVPAVFSGAPALKTMWLLLGGSAASVVGVAMTFRGSGKAP